MMRLHLWPIPCGHTDHVICRSRLAWLAYRWWAWPLQRRWARTRCREHQPVTVRVGTIAELTNRPGLGGVQRVVCAQCGATIRQFGVVAA